MEESTFLTKFASTVHLVHRRDAFRASPIMAARVKANEKIKIHWNSTVDEVLGTDKDGVTGVRIKDVATGATRELPAAGFFSAIGHTPNTSLVKDLGVELDALGYIVPKGRTTYTDVDGLFACGDVADHNYRQAITAAGSGCAAALDATRWLEAKESDDAMSSL